jgi:hypothetical protein
LDKAIAIAENSDIKLFIMVNIKCKPKLLFDKERSIIFFIIVRDCTIKKNKPGMATEASEPGL